MNVLRVLLFTIRLLWHRTDDDIAYRLDLASAIVTVTDDIHEQDLLAKIPRFESSYRRDVGECRVKGAAGEVTAWQILPRSDAERAKLCVSLVGDARVALARIRESLAACAQLPPDERLAVYTRGRCSSAEGKRLSKARWAK